MKYVWIEEPGLLVLDKTKLKVKGEECFGNILGAQSGICVMKKSKERVALQLKELWKYESMITEMSPRLMWVRIRFGYKR